MPHDTPTRSELSMANMTHTPRTYREAREVFRDHARRPRGGGALRVRLGNNTILHARGNLMRDRDGRADGWESYAVRLHDTDVVTFHRDGTITLDTGGWYSVTTADRMHDFTPESVRVSYRWSGGDHRLVVSVADGREAYTDWQGATCTRLTFRELVTSRDGEPVHLMPFSPADGVESWELFPVWRSRCPEYLMPGARCELPAGHRDRRHKAAGL